MLNTPSIWYLRHSYISGALPVSWANIAFMRVITLAICCWCLASDCWYLASDSWCLATDWASCFCTWASCSVSLEELFSNSEILWVVLVGSDGVEVNCEAFVALLPNGVIPCPIPRTRPGRSGPNTQAYASSLDQRIHYLFVLVVACPIGSKVLPSYSVHFPTKTK